MNTELMIESFRGCISKQENFPKFFIVEHCNKEYSELKMDWNDKAVLTIVVHKFDEIDSLLEMPIVGFDFRGETIRPILYDKSLDNKE